MANILIWDSPEKNSDLLYTTGFYAPDPVLFVSKGPNQYLFVSDLEFGRAKKESRNTEVIRLSRVFKNDPPVSISETIYRVLTWLKIKKVRVHWTFPGGISDFLRQKKISLQTVNGMLYPERAIKKPHEIKKIREQLKVAQQAISIVEDILARSEIRKDSVYYRGKRLSCEYLKQQVHKFFVSKDCTFSQSIISTGRQTAEPHNFGSGYIVPESPVVVDLFPRSLKHFYWGDITRTFFVGEPTASFVDLYDAVKSAQEKAISMIKERITTSKLHKTILEEFKKRGFKNKVTDRGPAGFIHNTGHGLGLDIHEYPRIGKSTIRLRKGHVVTVEPGLYYPDMGGVRIEDVVHVQKNGCKVLTDYPKSPVPQKW